MTPWVPPPLWAGQEAHVLASGPSATPEVIEGLRGRSVVVINSTALTAPWAPVWFFMDAAPLFRRERGRLVPQLSREGIDMVEFARSFAGMIVTTSRRVKEALPAVNLVAAERMKGFPPPGTSPIRYGRTSGQTGISLAIAMGAAKVSLHGFDMRAIDGVEHHHREYEGKPRDMTVYGRTFIPAFAGWNADAQAAGVSIVNATPGSALTEFPRATA